MVCRMSGGGGTTLNVTAYTAVPDVTDASIVYDDVSRELQYIVGGKTVATYDTTRQMMTPCPDVAP